VEKVKRFVILDARGNWFAPAIAVASGRGYEAHHVTRGIDTPKEGGGLGFLRPHADPRALKDNKEFDYPFMRLRTTMVQDQTQVELYEDKSAQFWRFGEFMPPTWRFENREKAVEFARREAPYPIVSKADVGASSVNVRIIRDRNELLGHIQLAFTKGIPVDHCAGGGKHGKRAASLQRGYVLLQQFIPGNAFTWRINAIGRGRAGFKRFNFPDRPVAQTGNVQPVMSLDEPGAAQAFAFADKVFAALKTNWCALDILTAGEQHYLLETSLAWPWPSPGTCDEAPFFGDLVQPRKWRGMWDLMIDEYERGTFDANSLAAHV
jgi:hypothetical protein